MGDMKREQIDEERGLGRQGLSKLNRKVDIAKNNKSILLRCENSVGF